MDFAEDREDPTAWPPGTVRIEQLFDNKKDIVLQPRPSDDPNDPLNWPRWRKNWNFAMVSLYSFMVFAFIDAVTPTWGPMNEQLGFSYTILNDSYAAATLALCFGAFILIPFALKFGRRPIYIVSVALQFAISIWSAKLQTVAELMLVNALSSFLGALAEVIVQMTVADVFFVHQRGAMNTVYIFTMLAGAYLAPVAAGAVTVTEGWRWVWWWVAILFAVLLVLFVFTYEETKYMYPGTDGTRPVSNKPPRVEVRGLTWEGKLEDVAVRNLSVTSFHSNPNHINRVIPQKTYWQRMAFITNSEGSLKSFLRHCWQPFVILFTLPAVFYMSLVYAVMLLWFTVMTTVLSAYMIKPPYNFDAAEIGLMSLAPFIGSLFGCLVCAPLSDWAILYLAKRNKGIYEPEMRLWVMAPFIPFLPAGAFMFGIGLADGRSWPIVAVGFALGSFGGAPVSSIALTYITDCYTEIVGDALVGVTFVRNALSAIFVFALTPWIDAMGIKNVFIIIGVFGTAVLLGTFFFNYYGKRLRIRTTKRYKFYAARQYGARKI